MQESRGLAKRITTVLYILIGQLLRISTFGMQFISQQL